MQRLEESERQDQLPQPAEISATLDRMPAQPAVDNDELEAAFWFHRSFVSAAITGKLVSPFDKNCSYCEQDASVHPCY